MTPGSPSRAEDGLPSTESENPVSRGLDSRTAREIVGIIHAEDLKAWESLDSELDTISEVVDVVDASECPPTFGVEPGLVEGFIAGGDRALRSAVEGAEDSSEDGSRVISEAAVGERDVVCGISASGRAPFVQGGLEEARARGAVTVLLAADGSLADASPGPGWDHLVIIDTGPECIAGSPRMKAGPATKMVLNIITTAALVRWGSLFLVHVRWWCDLHII